MTADAIDADAIDADSHAELTAKVIQCHEELQKYLTLLASKKSMLGRFHAGFDKADTYIGGKEALAMKYAIASCDKNGDGKISKEELEKLQESSADILSAHTEAQMNAGVVAALILSFMVPLSLEPIEASDDCVDFFGQSAVKYLRILSTSSRCWEMYRVLPRSFSQFALGCTSTGFRLRMVARFSSQLWTQPCFHSYR